MSVVINYFGGPGVGKSVAMAKTFTDLKVRGYNVEMLSEVAKQFIYEDRMNAVSNDYYLVARVNYLLSCLNDKVDIVVMDGSILNTNIYSKWNGKYSENFGNVVTSLFYDYDNISIYLTRDTEFKSGEGRIHSEEESKTLDKLIEEELKLREVDYRVFSPIKYEDILEYILSELNQRHIDISGVSKSNKCTHEHNCRVREIDLANKVYTMECLKCGEVFLSTHNYAKYYKYNKGGEELWNIE